MFEDLREGHVAGFGILASSLGSIFLWAMMCDMPWLQNMAYTRFICLALLFVYFLVSGFIGFAALGAADKTDVWEKD